MAAITEHLFIFLILTTCVELNELNTTATLKNISAIDNMDNITVLEKHCIKDKVIARCCPENEILQYDYEGSAYCSPCNSTYQIDLPIYNSDIMKLNTSVTDNFCLVYNSTVLNFSLEGALDPTLFFDNRVYLTEDGSVWVDTPNVYNRWMNINNSHFCVGNEWKESDEPSYQSVILLVYGEEVMEQSSYFYICAMLVSCVFLLLVLVVYVMLPELHNLCGMVLMAYVFSLLMAFLWLATLQILAELYLNTESICLGFTYVIYFAFLASFCWMNVMSFDIWWTFRGYAKARPIHRRGEKFKFFVYCLYAWGLPLVMTIGLAVIESMDLSHIRWFIKPNIIRKGSFLSGEERMIYLYTPMLILIICNCLFFLLTVYNIWRLNRDTAVLDSPAAGTKTAHRAHRHRLMVYLKLSVIMGVNWMLEVISSFKPQFTVWYVTDMYNMLMGLAIFLIFVCNKNKFVKLRNKFRRSKSSLQWHRNSKSQSTATTESDVSAETPLRVCGDPKGPTFFYGNAASNFASN